jgi:hypothetical protein
MSVRDTPKMAGTCREIVGGYHREIVLYNVLFRGDWPTKTPSIGHLPLPGILQYLYRLEAPRMMIIRSKLMGR